MRKPYTNYARAIPNVLLSFKNLENLLTDVITEPVMLSKNLYLINNEL